MMTPEQKTQYEELALEVCATQHSMTDEQRLQFWYLIQKSYCIHCGREVHPFETRCHCSNDD